MKNIQVDIDASGIALLKLNRPAVLNVLNVPLMTELCQALDTLSQDDTVRALVLTGEGRGFCAGADLGGIGAEATVGESLGQMVSDSMREHFNPMMERLYGFPKPVITALNGIAAGGGAGIALCADVVIAANSATLKVVQVPQLGIVADLGANWLLPRLGGRGRALGACLLGETLTASTLYEWGLVWECVEDKVLLARATAIALKLANVPAETVVATRGLIDSALQMEFPDMLEKERLVQETLCNSPVFRQSVAEFLSKR